MGLMDWGKSELEDLGIISPPAATDQGSLTALSSLPDNYGAVNLVGPASVTAEQEAEDQAEGRRITAPVDAAIAADPQHLETPPPNYWHTEDNPYYTQ